ncbi:hypothetical protein ADZ37_18165 [Pannonibacter phragmitetus]|nr:hypothetical protein ADZ37_18165 [Pannonibacter phragmitetus]
MKAMATLLPLVGGGAPRGGVNGQATLLSEVTGHNRASRWSFGYRRRVISLTGSNALETACNLQPIRLSQHLNRIRIIGRSQPIHAISLEGRFLLRQDAGRPRLCAFGVQFA